MSPQHGTWSRRRRARRWLVGGCTGLACCAVLAWGAATVALPAAAAVGHPITVVIRRGMGLRAIALSLYRAGVVRRAWAFEFWAVIGGDAGRLPAGTYALDPGLSPRTLLQRIVAGDVQVRRVTIPEGFTDAQIVGALQAARLGGGTAALRAAVGDTALLARAGLPAPAAQARTATEGYLFPDTYLFAPQVTAEQIVQQMLGQFAAVWTPQLAAGIQAHTGLDTEQAVTLASIVQREVGAPAQMPLVAGIYLHRLAVGMRLDADPTVLYGLGLLSQQHALTTAQTQTPTPYNTYLLAGLPPGPICNPGQAALEAVAEATPTQALYFLTDAQGKVITADTLAQQIANEQRYLGG